MPNNSAKDSHLNSFGALVQGRQLSLPEIALASGMSVLAQAVPQYGPLEPLGCHRSFLVITLTPLRPTRI
jgi:hypothetical protein